MKKQWYLLKIENELPHPIDVEISKEKLVTKQQALQIIMNN